jgi:glycosyltransferase involved in cell wall biosynthesis
MAGEPKISIVTTVHNAAPYLREAIQSVLAHSLSDLELILWDDGSTDESVEIGRELAASDARVRFIAAEHKGRAVALAEACKLARGEYLGVVDADDVLEPTALAECVAHLDAHPATGMIYTDHVVMDAEGKARGLGRRCQIPYSKDHLLLDFMTFHFRLMRGSVYEAAGGFDPSYPLAMDYDLCLRLSEITQIDHLARPLYRYRRRRGSLSSTRRLDQVLYAHAAVHAAMDRRGMSGEYACDLEIQARHILRKRTAA